MDGTVVGQKGVERKAGEMGFTKSFCRASLAWRKEKNTQSLWQRRKNSVYVNNQIRAAELIERKLILWPRANNKPQKPEM